MRNVEYYKTTIFAKQVTEREIKIVSFLRSIKINANLYFLYNYEIYRFEKSFGNLLYTFYKGKGQFPKTLLLFNDIIDYLSYLTYYSVSLSVYDVIVLNGIKNLPTINNKLLTYEKVHSFLGNDNVGIENFDKLHEFCSSEFIVLKNYSSTLHPNFENFNDFLRSKRI
jgi:hypothetical protein